MRFGLEDIYQNFSGTMLFTDADRDDVGHTATVEYSGATGVTSDLDVGLIEDAVSIDDVTKAENSQFGSVAWSFTAAANTFDYLARGETVVLTYNGDGG